MKNWNDNENGTVTLNYAEGDIVVSKADFDRTFGTMVNGSYADIKRDFGI